MTFSSSHSVWRLLAAVDRTRTHPLKWNGRLHECWRFDLGRWRVRNDRRCAGRWKCWHWRSPNRGSSTHGRQRDWWQFHSDRRQLTADRWCCYNRWHAGDRRIAGYRWLQGERRIADHRWYAGDRWLQGERRFAGYKWFKSHWRHAGNRWRSDWRSNQQHLLSSEHGRRIFGKQGYGPNGRRDRQFYWCRHGDGLRHLYGFL